jgi:threonine/homoserine/homoserine lactone efflux protein
VFVVGLAALALKYPAAAAVVVLAGVVLMLVFATWIVRAVKRRWAARAPVAITP